MSLLQFHQLLLLRQLNKFTAAIAALVLLSTAVSGSPAEDSAYLNKKIHSLYTSLQDGKKILAVKNFNHLSADTYLNFLGTYPSRYGFIVTKVNFKNLEGGKKSSVSRSLTLEFNGPVLSKVNLEVKSEDIQNFITTNIQLTDPTPMDQNYKDWILKKSVDGLGEPVLFSDLNDTDNFVLNFKRNFYIKMIEEFLMIIDLIESKKEEHPVQNIMKNLHNSLE